MTIQEYFGDWVKVLNINEANRLLRYLKNLHKSICPQIKDIFKAFNLCSLHNLKVVILGQDPYSDYKNGIPTATGIAFGNISNTPEKDYSPSLDILKESIIDFTYPHNCINFDASLEEWEAQGVLLLNSALSCEAGKAGSHALLWRPFIRALLTNLSTHESGIIYVLMGQEAQSFESYINSRYNYIIKVRHPSYYARTKTQMPHELWTQINKILISIYGFGINWYKEFNYLNENKNEEEVFYEEFQ